MHHYPDRIHIDAFPSSDLQAAECNFTCCKTAGCTRDYSAAREINENIR